MIRLLAGLLLLQTACGLPNNLSTFRLKGMHNSDQKFQFIDRNFKVVLNAARSLKLENFRKALLL